MIFLLMLIKDGDLKLPCDENISKANALQN